MFLVSARPQPNDSAARLDPLREYVEDPLRMREKRMLQIFFSILLEDSGCHSSIPAPIHR